MKRIYFDHAATTYCSDRAREAMLPYFSEVFGNANSLHSFGREAQKAVDSARDRIAKCFGVKASEIYFTSGGTESDNWALKGVMRAHRSRGNHLITTKIEHHAILHACQQLEKDGFEVTYLDVNADGIVDPKQLEAAITDRTVLVSVMAANNEMGAIQPIEEIGRICRAHNVFFHTDAVQAIGAVPIDIERMNIDLLSLSAHKFYGPKGIGVLYKRNSVRIDKLIIGGAQERNMRGGTTDTPLIVGMAAALEDAVRDMEKNNAHSAALRDRLLGRIEKEIPFVRVNGSRTKRLPNNANVSFEYIEGESILMSLDLAGIAVSSGSACTSGSLDPSHVLLAMGLPEETAHGSIRFTFGKCNTMEDVDYAVDKLKEIIEKLRNMSPLFHNQRGELKYV